MRLFLITLVVVVLIGCKAKSIEKEVNSRLLGDWQPVAFYIDPPKVSRNLKPGWNLTNDFLSVSFRVDGTFYDPRDITGATIRYQVLDDHQLSFIDENNKATIYDYEFRADTLVTITNCADQLYCGWKYIPQP